jgi:hypothetical protein
MEGDKVVLTIIVLRDVTERVQLDTSRADRASERWLPASRRRSTIRSLT